MRGSSYIYDTITHETAVLLHFGQKFHAKNPCFSEKYRNFAFGNHQNPTGMPKILITKAENAGNLTVSLTFSDNTVQTVDVGDYIRRHPHPQYNKYLDPRKFSRFTLENGNIVWGKNWDMIFPVEQLYAGAVL